MALSLVLSFSYSILFPFSFSVAFLSVFFDVSMDANGCGSKPCIPGEHQNRWQMDVHPPQNGAIGYAPWPNILHHLRNPGMRNPL